MYNINDVIEKDAARQYSPVVLAFIGDAVFSLYVRKKLCFSADYKPNDLQKLSSKIVSAKGQAELYAKLRERMNEDEDEIFHRGRNAKKTTKSKNASVAEYNISTGFEAVIGYLYISGQTARLNELFSFAFDGDE